MLIWTKRINLLASILTLLIFGNRILATFIDSKRSFDISSGHKRDIVHDETLKTNIIHDETLNTNSSFYSMDVGLDISNLWYVNVSLTEQEQRLRVDIAQPYVWVVNSETNQDFDGPTYDVNLSRILPFSDKVYNMSFIDNIQLNSSAYLSEMVLQDIEINELDIQKSTSNSLNINQLGFFAAYDSPSLIGSLGLSGEINNTNWQSTQIATDDFNSSFLALEAMTEEGTISHAGYSLWLAGNVGNEVDLNEYQINASDYVFSNFSVGSLMLNYVNSSLFTGDLVKFESIPYFEVFTEGQSFSSNGYPIFPLSGSNLISNTSETVNLTSTDDITPILFDSRFTVSYLPIDIIQQIAIQTNAFYVASVESWYVDCELGNINAYIEFLFGQLSIKVPLNEFITNAYLSTGPDSDTQLFFKSATGKKTSACVLKMKPSYLSGINVLGGAFLKYAYLAADLETNEFALAQAANINGEILNTVTAVKKSANKSKHKTISSSATDDSKGVTTITSSAMDDSKAVTTVSNVLTDSGATTSTSTVSKETASNSESISKTESSTATVMHMSSGFIPFAKSSNITEASLVFTTFSAATTDSTEYGANILEIFGYNFTYGSIFSNGEIVTATKSFYNTDLSSAQLTTLSGSTFYTTISTKHKKSSSVYVLTVEYETYVTKVNAQTTMYGTSAVTAVSYVPLASVTKSYKNSGQIAFKHSGEKGICNRLLHILGLTGLIWLLV